MVTATKTLQDMFISGYATIRATFVATVHEIARQVERKIAQCNSTLIQKHFWHSLWL